MAIGELYSTTSKNVGINMAGHSLHVEKFETSQRLKTVIVALIGIGIIGFAVGLMQNQQRLWTSYLTAYFYVACLSLGGMFFVAINNLAKAGWSTSIRRFAEGMASFIPMLLFGGVILFFGFKHLYPWLDHDYLEHHHIVHKKLSYLNVGFMAVRVFVYLLGSWLFMKLIVGNSLAQDKSGSETHTKKNVGLSIGYILFFAIFFSLFTVDLLMSLMPTWYSTIFGVYAFAGMAQSSMAFMVLLIFYMIKHCKISGYVTLEHIHDIGKFTKGFTVFWAYIAFSQFMLIWYANIPEETEFFLLRSENGWMEISMSLLVLRFIVPFLLLLPRWAKRAQTHVSAVCILILVMQYVDLYWLVYPNFNGNKPVFGFYEITLFCGFFGLFLLSLTKFYSKNQVIALKDPRLHEAVAHHVAY
jgi:hypothetical protein